MKLYLAHPFNMRHEIREWELDFERHTGITLDNPFYDNHRGDIRKFDEGLAEPRTIKTKEDGLYIVNKDLREIERDDGILAFIFKGQESMGSPMELFYASRILHRPSYVVTNCSGHPWVKGLATELFKSKEEFEKYVLNKNG